MGKLAKGIAAFIIMISSQSWGVTLDNLFLNQSLVLEQILLQDTLPSRFKPHKKLPIHKTAKKLLSDPLNRVSNNFKVPRYFKNQALFWFKIYTHFSSDHVVIHDKKNMNLIWDTIDFSELDFSGLGPFAQERLRSRFLEKKIRAIKNELNRLARNRRYHSPLKIKKILRASGYKIPRNHRRRRQFYKRLARRLRWQEGQRDIIHQGLLNSMAYEGYIKEYFRKFKIPSELMAIAFLESSFNLQAKSKVGASGIWQFMPRTARKVLPMSPQMDTRRNPVIASLGAMHLLRENYKIHKRWDLAITAYNSGHRHLFRAKKKLRRRGFRRISLETIFKHYRHRNIGFASKNFYPEFLALAHTLAYKEQLFPIKGLEKESLPKGNVKRKNLDVYVSLCGFIPKRLFTAKGRHLDLLNPHLLADNKIYRRGTLIVSDRKLDRKRYDRVPDRVLTSTYPKFWRVKMRRRCRAL